MELRERIATAVLGCVYEVRTETGVDERAMPMDARTQTMVDLERIPDAVLAALTDGFGVSIDDLQTIAAWCESARRTFVFGNSPYVGEALVTVIDRLVTHARAMAGDAAVQRDFVLVERKQIERLRHDLAEGNTRSALGHARWIVDHAPVAGETN